MLIRQNQYPEFDPEKNQLLTSDHLNKLFGYVDEQDRLTRANLIGIGILCGLEVSVNDAGTEITISKGVGITSLGYIVSTETRTYTEFKTYDVTQDRKYGLFVNNNNRPKFHIDELKPEASDTGTTPLTAAYLQNRVVVMYVELLAENSKNCDPSSCDDKGINVTVNFRPLLIHRDDVAKYMGARTTTQGVMSGIQSTSLPILQMRRFNVPSTPIVDSPSLLGAYQAILTQSFFTSLESSLTQSYNVVAALLSDMYPSNPFAGLATRYKFLYDGSITASDLVYIQYYYDLFADACAAYNSFRQSALKIIGVCLPDEVLFPQHLLLGPAGNFAESFAVGSQQGELVKLAPVVADTTNISYRNNFTPSAAMRSCCGEITEMRSLFKCLMTILSKFSVQRQNFTIVQTVNNTPATAPISPVIANVSNIGNIAIRNASSSFSVAAQSSDLVRSVVANSNTLPFIANNNLSFVAVAKPTGTPASINISTGVNASGVVQAANATEVNWICPVTMNKVTAPHPAWDTLSGSAYIGNSAGIAAGNYTFTRTFNIPAAGTLNFQAMGDNTLTIKLDNKQIAQTPNATTYGFKLLNVVNYTGSVTAGSHTITVTLYNEGGPAGFDLKGSIAYTIPAPTPPPPPPLPPKPPVQINIPLRVTPSFLGKVPLADKSIPFYYDVTGGTEPLYRQWNYDKTLKGKADRNLSYNSVLYNNGNPDYTNKALRYDLEKYNFFRVEGHIGGIEADMLAKITAIRDQYRLPFEVITLRSTLAAAVTNAKQGCCTDGIELPYAILKAEWTDIADKFIDYISNTPEAAALFNAADFTGLLGSAKSYLKEDVPSFVANYTAFIGKLDQIDTNGRNYRSAIQALIGRKQASFKLGEDLIDRLDEVILSYKKNAFTEIYNAYKLSLASVKRELSIQEYLQDNPGIQHKAGVPKGGTLILVYHTKAAATQTQTSTQTGANNQQQNSVERVAALSANVNVAAVAPVSVSTGSSKVTAVNFDVVKAIDDLYVARNSGVSPVQLEKQILDAVWLRDVRDVAPVSVKPAVTVKTVNILDSVIEGTVIADFFVPYICCDDCPTISFAPGEDPVEQATVAIEKKTFCVNNEQQYLITTTPAGGALTGDGIVQNAGKYYFDPSTVNVPAGSNFVEPTITYTTTGSTAFVKLKVYADPLADFTATVNGDTVTIVNNSTNFNDVAWDFGDGFTSTVFNPSPHVYQQPGPYTITLTANNGECMESTTRSITIQDVTLNINTALREFCQGDAAGQTTYNITVSPTNAVLTIDNVTATPVGAGTYNYRPADLSLTAGTSKTIVIKATKGGLSKSISVKVNAVPNASFTQSIDGARATFSYTPVTGNTTLWNFGDGTTSTVASPVHDFPGAGTYNVSLTVTNGNCPKTTTVPITITPATVSVSPSGTNICLWQDQAVRTVTVSPAGGVLSGEGVVAGTPYTFDPRQVVFTSSITEKDVLLTYTKGSLSATTLLKVYKNISLSFSYTQNIHVANFSYTPEPGTTQVWDFGDGTTSTQVSPSHTYADYTSYTVKLTVTNGPCSKMIQQTVTMVQPPQPQLGVSDGRREFCTSDTGVTLTASPAGGVFTRDGNVISGTTYTFNPSQQGVGFDPKNITFNYALNGSNATVVLAVNPLPTAMFNSSGLNLTYTLTNASPGTTVVSWDFGDGKTGTGQSVTHTWATDGTYPVRLTVNNGKCTGTTVVNMAVYRSPVVSVTNAGPFCADDGNPVTVSAIPAGGTLTLNGTTVSAPYTFNPAQAGANPNGTPKDYKFTYAFGGNSDSKTLTVTPLPTATFSYVQVNGLTYRFTNTSGSGITVTGWDLGDGNSGNGETIEHTFAGPGVYDVFMSVTNGSCFNGVNNSVTVAGSACNLPCNGITETTQYPWSSKKSFVQNRVYDTGKPYTFYVTEYVVDKQVLVAKGDNLRFDISKAEYDRSGYQAIFDALSGFEGGLQFRYDAENLLFNGDFINFDIKHFVCQTFRLSIVDFPELDQAPFTYMYTEAGLFMDGEAFPYEQKLNPIIADECIDTRPEPCASLVMCEYQWPHKDSDYEQWMSKNEYIGYDIVVHRYIAGDTTITDHNLHYVIPFNEFKQGLQDALDMLNSHFLFRERIRFDSVDGQNGNSVNISRYACLDFEFDFTVAFTRNGIVIPETEMHYLYGSNGTFLYQGTKPTFLGASQNCQPTTYVPPQPPGCKLPCDGLTNTSVFAWPDTQEDIWNMMNQPGEHGTAYSFTLGRYTVGNLVLNQEPMEVVVYRSSEIDRIMPDVLSYLNADFREGLYVDDYTEMKLPQLNGRVKLTPYFTVKQAACESYSMELTSLITGDVYTYTQNNMIVNGDPVTDGPVNTVMTDECINIRPVPCSKSTTKQYRWLHSDDELKSMASKGQTYSFRINSYIVNDKTIISRPQFHILPAEAYRNGWRDIANYLNSRLKVANGITFNTLAQSADISLTYPECTKFSFSIVGYGTSITYTDGSGK